MIVIGASTSGPQTLELILPFLPADFSLPVLVVQHMSNRFFSESLSGHLNKSCSLKVKVACDNETISAPAVYLAPGGSHLELKLRGTTDERGGTKSESSIVPHPSSIVIRDVVICLNKAESDSLTPSIDLAMQSIAKAYQKNSIGIILSGIGNDGLEGMRSIKEAGGRTIVQDESALIFGMPKAVIDAGLADKVLPAQEIGRVILAFSG